MFRISSLILFLSLFSLYTVTHADIPVHCTPKQMRDKWMLELVTLSHGSISPVELKEKCTISYLNEHSDNAAYLLMDIMPPNLAYVEEIHDKSSGLRIKENEVFNFTLMSDQAFELRGKNYNLFSFFSYEKQPRGYIKSECDRSQVGWFSDNEKKVWGCFIADKWKSRKSDVVIHKPISDSISFEDNVHISDDDDTKPFSVDEERVQHINNAQQSWVAHAYPHYKTMSVAEMKAKQGTPLRAYTQEEARLQIPHATADIDDDNDISSFKTSFFNKRNDARKAFPKRFDWRNVNGSSFISPVRDQKVCGSCFAMATIDALEARIRVQSKNKHKLDLAVQDVISCSPFSQQCKGGYPLAVAKYANDFGIVPEECMPYKAENGTCSSKCKNPKAVARAKSYEYVGGYLTAGNELDMIREIYENGPIVGSFMVNDDFKYYRKGIYRHVEGKAGKKGEENPIEFTSHSICIIGWDEDEKTGEKSWIIKNSWGKLFGEEAPKDSPFWKENCANNKDGEPCGGFFRMRRGADESAIESAAVSFLPELVFPKQD